MLIKNKINRKGLLLLLVIVTAIAIINYMTLLNYKNLYINQLEMNRDVQKDNKHLRNELDGTWILINDLSEENEALKKGK